MKAEEEKEKKKLHNTNFIDACNNAVNGILYATTTQSNVRKQLVIAVTVMILSLFYNFTTSEFLCLTFAVFLVIFAEMINTAIETVVDLFTDQYHPKAKIAKDVAAGAVVLVAINACVVAYFLFFRETELSQMGTTILDYVVASPMHIAFVGIILAVIGILAGKAYINHKKQVGKRLIRVYYHIEKPGEERLADLIVEYRQTNESIEKVLSYSFEYADYEGEKNE